MYDTLLAGAFEVHMTRRWRPASWKTFGTSTRSLNCSIANLKGDSWPRIHVSSVSLGSPF
jgi:hypothetical protein